MGNVRDAGVARPVFLAGMLNLRLAQAAVGDLVLELRSKPPPADLRDSLARVLRDPSLQLAHWLPDSGCTPIRTEARSSCPTWKAGRRRWAIGRAPLLSRDPATSLALTAGHGDASHRRGRAAASVQTLRVAPRGGGVGEVDVPLKPVEVAVAVGVGIGGVCSGSEHLFAVVEEVVVLVRVTDCVRRPAGSLRGSVSFATSIPSR